MRDYQREERTGGKSPLAERKMGNQSRSSRGQGLQENQIAERTLGHSRGVQYLYEVIVERYEE